MRRITSRSLFSGNPSISAIVGASRASPTSSSLRPSFRTLMTLREKHKTFLQLVDCHGTGSVTLTYDYPKQIATLSLSNESLRNAISGRMMNQLADALDILLDDGSKLKKEIKQDYKAANKFFHPVVGVIVRSSGKIFSAGADLNLARDLVNTPALGIAMSQFMVDCFSRLRTSGFVSVCLINGTAVGGGAEIATVCDYRLMTDLPDKHICFIHAKIGASPGWGGAARLVSIVGRQKALRLLGTSVKVLASEALALGLIDGIVTSTDAAPSDPQALQSTEPVYDAALQAAGEEFLLPFTAQPFCKSVQAAKTLVASSEFLSKKHVAEMELKIFGERWASLENKASAKK